MEGYRWKAAVVTLSDKGFAGEREDKSGPLICEMLTEAGYDVQGGFPVFLSAVGWTLPFL